MHMSIEPKVLFRRLENKEVSARDLSRYLGAKSLEDLLVTLRRLAYSDYFEYEVMLSEEYFDWQQAHRNVIFGNDIVDDIGYAHKLDTYRLTVKAETPLSEEEVIDIVKKLPTDLAKQYFIFRLRDIDSEKLAKLFVVQHGSDDEFEDRVEYNGLIVDGVEVTYNGESVDGLGFQHRQALRLLAKKGGRLCFKDEFKGAEAGIFEHEPSEHALRNLIYEVRKALRRVTSANCIKNTPGEGWSLTIEP